MPLNSHAVPNFYSAVPSFTTTSTGAANVFDVGFQATAIRVVNSCNDDVYARFDGTVPTSGDLRIRACSDLSMSGLPPFSYVGFYTTSTAHKLNLTVLGG